MTQPQLAEIFTEMGEQPFRARQVFSWLHKKRVGSFNEMSSLPLALRDKCNEKFTLNPIKTKKRLVSDIDSTVKYLYGLYDGCTVESAVMHYRHGTSVCISTQAGCKMGCAFCASDTGGFARDLTAGEMLDEVYTAQKDLETQTPANRVSGVVLMGIGEPLDNFENTLRFLELISSPGGFNLSARRISLSTCGLADKIDGLADYKLGITLSVSLHAPNDEIRNQLMPINNKWPIDALLSSCKRYFDKTGRRVSYEYALIDNVNDRPEHAAQLAAKLKGTKSHVNLIRLNDVPGKPYRAPGQSNAAGFAKILTEKGITTTVRRRLGSDINAACGQLRQEEVPSH
ncbi:MAG: 23S rRNA (adenine(2503)-C(2))-methyltransferase RlmN [Oscillospiraceae bacterium]|nr:23S rRNA (adenine(2503)-C(2))-methyltransferase RlmN [Oscillospiraceae bacterium]